MGSRYHSIPVLLLNPFRIRSNVRYSFRNVFGKSWIRIPFSSYSVLKNSDSTPELPGLLVYEYPELLKIELSNGYKPSDYEKGIFHYVKKRIFKKYILKSYNPPSFSYGQWYIDFVTKNSNLVQNEIWEYFDQKAYFHALKENQHASNEGYWHKFSNPIFFNLKKLSK